MKIEREDLPNLELKHFVSDLALLAAVPVNQKFRKLVLDEYPFDPQLLSSSAVYRKSRSLFLKIGGSFVPRVCSTMRSLSTQDLFERNRLQPSVFRNAVVQRLLSRSF
ncbi:MAG: hypothetical protein V4736_13275 [Bdellovibrionota bacterium]